jgi:hypothetical protein
MLEMADFRTLLSLTHICARMPTRTVYTRQLLEPEAAAGHCATLESPETAACRKGQESRIKEREFLFNQTREDQKRYKMYWR